MSLGKTRLSVFVKGLGNLGIRKLEPTADLVFTDAGYLQSAVISDAMSMVDIISDNGLMLNYLAQSEKVGMQLQLLQSSFDEINLLKAALTQAHAVRYYGMTDSTHFQFISFESGRFDPSVNLDFKPGLRTVPMNYVALFQDVGYAIPLWYMIESRAELRISDLGLFLAPRAGLNNATAKLLDVSGFGRHATLNSNFASMWQPGTTPPNFLRFNGTTDQADCGNVSALNDDGSADFMIDGWIKFPGSAGTVEEVLTKKSLISDNSAGFSISRNASNQIAFRIASGAANVTITTAATVTSTWTHFAVAVDRNGNAQLYINGAASGSAASVAAIGSGTNALSYYIGRDGTNFGQVDVGVIRHYSIGANNLPADIGTWISNAYSGERAIFNV